MSWREANAVKLDFEDLVKELDQFEQDIQSLQHRINQFLNDARQTPGQDETTDAIAPVDSGESGGA